MSETEATMSELKVVRILLQETYALLIKIRELFIKGEKHVIATSNSPAYSKK